MADNNILSQFLTFAKNPFEAVGEKVRSSKQIKFVDNVIDNLVEQIEAEYNAYKEKMDDAAPWQQALGIALPMFFGAPGAIAAGLVSGISDEKLRSKYEDIMQGIRDKREGLIGEDFAQQALEGIEGMKDKLALSNIMGIGTSLAVPQLFKGFGDIVGGAGDFIEGIGEGSFRDLFGIQGKEAVGSVNDRDSVNVGDGFYEDMYSDFGPDLIDKNLKQGWDSSLPEGKIVQEQISDLDLLKPESDGFFDFNLKEPFKAPAIDMFDVLGEKIGADKLMTNLPGVSNLLKAGTPLWAPYLQGGMGYGYNPAAGTFPTAKPRNPLASTGFYNKGGKVNPLLLKDFQ